MVNHLNGHGNAQSNEHSNGHVDQRSVAPVAPVVVNPPKAVPVTVAAPAMLPTVAQKTVAEEMASVVLPVSAPPAQSEERDTQQLPPPVAHPTSSKPIDKKPKMDDDSPPLRTPRPEGTRAFRTLHITFRRSGNLERDKFRLKEIYDAVRDPRGRDHFLIRLEGNGARYELAFPNDGCTISERLTQDLARHFRVEVTVDEKPA